MRKILMTLALAGCGGGEDVPSCQQAVTHYYEAGCTLVDLQTGQPFSAGAVIENCKGLLASAPPQCEDDLADLRSCFGGVPSPAMQNADCDCTAEQDAILTCE